MKKRKLKIIILLLSISFYFIIYTGFFIRNLYGWDRNPLIIPAGSSEPILNGIKDNTEDWNKDNYCNTSIQVSQSGFPDVVFYGFTKNNYLFIMIEVKITNPNDDQYVRILFSNSSSSSDEDFIDAKLIQNRNLTKPENHTFYLEDHILIDGTYTNDTVINFEGAANVSGPNKYTYYEFKIPFSSNNNDTINDTSILAGGNKYAIKIEYGVAPIDGQKTQFKSPTLIIQVGYPPVEGEKEIKEFKIDIELLSKIMFIIVGIGLGIIFLITVRGKSKI